MQNQKAVSFNAKWQDVLLVFWQNMGNMNSILVCFITLMANNY